MMECKQPGESAACEQEGQGVLGQKLCERKQWGVRLDSH